MKSFLVKIEKSLLVIRKNGIVGGMRILAGYLGIFFRAMFAGSGDVLFVTDGVGDSSHYRAFNPKEELNLHGIKASVSMSDSPFLLGLVSKFKIFIFRRTVNTTKIAKFIEEIKRQKKEIIFDTDDLVYDPKYLVHMDLFSKMSHFEKEQYKKGIGGDIINDPYVRTCTTSTSYLAEKLQEKNKKVIIVSNKFSQEELEICERILQNTKKVDDGFTYIGYLSGTYSHNKDFATIVPALATILEKYSNVKLVLAGPLDTDDSLNKYKDRVEILPRVPRKKYWENVYRLDINLAPLELGNPFCEAKSEIKFIEAGVFGIPTVAVRNQTFSEAISDGEDGFLADNTNEWIEKIGKLIENKIFRNNMGKKARQKVLHDYTNKNSHSEEYYNYLRNKL